MQLTGRQIGTRSWRFGVGDERACSSTLLHRPASHGRGWPRPAHLGTSPGEYLRARPVRGEYDDDEKLETKPKNIKGELKP